MKKILNTILVLALLVLVPTFVVNAVSGTNNDSGVITIDNAIEGKTYSAYQILKLESYDTEKSAYTYTVASAWSDFIHSDAIKNVYVKVDSQGYVTWIDTKSTDSDMKTFAQLALAYAKENSIAATKSQTAASEEDENTTTIVTFTGLNLGYYLVDSSVGAICSLTTTKTSAEATEKNTVPTLEKDVKENSTGVWGDENNATIGQTVEYRTTITASAGAENYVLYDIMDEGLTYNGVTSIKVTTKEGTTTVDSSNYTISTTVEGYTFVITFAKEFTDTLVAGDKVVVEYTALLNEKAVIYDEYNENKTWLEYGDKSEENKTPVDTTKTYTYRFDLVKTDSSNKLLTGATFKLLDNNKNEIKLVKVSDGVYRVATKEEYSAVTYKAVVIEAGKVTINGLDSGTYYLEEITPPSGYNKLASAVEFKIEDVNLDATVLENVWSQGGVHVINLTGAELPTTGGMGTVLFVVIGSIMVLGAGVLLVVRLRMSKMNA